MDNGTALMTVAAGWIAYFTVHSLLASTALKRRFTGLRCYRLIYNLVALALLLPVAALHALYHGDKVVIWGGPWLWLALLLNISAVSCFLWTLRYYDLGEFSGWRRCREGEDGTNGTQLVLSPPHRFVRHPWYSCALALIWCRDMDGAQLLSTLLMSAYFIIGSRFEERRLLAEFGEPYREYLNQVSGLIPLPWKILSRESAGRLLEKRSPD